MTSSLEILAYEETPLGILCLRRRESLKLPGTMITEVTLDHEFLMSSYLTESERALARSALKLHAGSELSVLVGGLGLGYTAYEALKHADVASVRVIEFLPQVISWLRQGMIPLAAELTADERLIVEQGDVYATLLRPDENQYDVILIDVDHSPEDRLDDSDGGFYSEAGLACVGERLRSEGVLGVWSYEQNDPFAKALRHVFSEVIVETVTVENDLIDVRQTDWLYFARK